MGETNSSLVAHVGYDISPLSRRLVVKILDLIFLSGEIS
jgi:hypothetical protein